jgi:hypothetical protein
MRYRHVFLNDPQTFTQDDVNRFLAEDRKKHQQKLAEAENRIKELGLSVEQNGKLKDEFNKLQETFLTKEQLAAQEREKLVKEGEAKAKALTDEVTRWKTLHHSTLVNQSILSAATETQAVNPQQLLLMLGHQAEVVEQDGIFDVVIPFSDTDPKTKQPVTLKLPVLQALKRMTELPDKFGNLFKTTLKSGTGQQPTVPTKGGAIDFASMTSEQYEKWRQSQGLKK